MNLPRLLILALAMTGLAACAQSKLPDSPESRMRLADKLVAIQSAQSELMVREMLNVIEAGLPADRRPAFHTLFFKVFDFNELRRVTSLVMAKNLSTEELEAMIGFYGSPAGQSVLSKMPQLFKDTTPLVQAMVLKAIRQLPADQRPPKFRDL